MRFLLVLILSSAVLAHLVLGILYVRWYWGHYLASISVQEVDGPDKMEIVSAMRFHGVRFAYQEDGVWYSRRGRVKFKLFNSFYLSRKGSGRNKRS